MTVSFQLIARMGASRQGAIDRLRDMGVPVPKVPLAAQRRDPSRERVWIEREQAQSVVAYVGRHFRGVVGEGFSDSPTALRVSARADFSPGSQLKPALDTFGRAAQPRDFVRPA